MTPGGSGMSCAAVARTATAIATCGTVMSHAESIELFKSLDVKMTPELKTPSVAMPYGGDYTQEQFAQQIRTEIADYRSFVAKSGLVPQ